MSNNNAEAATAKIESPAAAPVAPAANFDVLQLHSEAVGLKAPTQVAENNLTPAVYHPGENGAHIEDVQYRGGGGAYGHPGPRTDFRLNFGIAGAYGYDYGYQGYPYAVAPMLPPVTCYPSRVWGAPPVCVDNYNYGGGTYLQFGVGPRYIPEPRRFEYAQPRHYR